MGIAELVGKIVLFVGNRSYQWTLNDFVNAAVWCRANGVDSLCVKSFDGGIAPPFWPQWKNIRSAVLAHGTGILPFSYMYGPRFGRNQIYAENDCLKRMLDANENIAAIDLEGEYNGQTGAASILASILPSGHIACTTWADPNLQNWDGILSILNPHIEAFVPQAYDNFLASQPFPENVDKTFPAIDLTAEFGPNNPVGIAQAKENYPSIWLWEYASAVSQPSLVHSISFVKHGSDITGPPQQRVYYVQSGDTLSAIASKFGESVTLLYNRNKTTIENTAIRHGYPSSNNGNWIFPGEELVI